MRTQDHETASRAIRAVAATSRLVEASFQAARTRAASWDSLALRERAAVVADLTEVVDRIDGMDECLRPHEATSGVCGSLIELWRWRAEAATLLARLLGMEPDERDLRDVDVPRWNMLSGGGPALSDEEAIAWVATVRDIDTNAIRTHMQRPIAVGPRLRIVAGGG